MGQRFNGKTVLITGGNSGIGFATAKQIVTEGGKVIITGRDAQTLKQAQQELGPAAEAFQADVGKLLEIEGLFAKIKQKHTRLDGVFANAGVAKFTPATQVTEEEFDTIFDINVKGVYFTLQKSLPFLGQGSSVVINSSVTGSQGGSAISVYGATKAAVRSFARTFSTEFVSQGIRFNVISPGPIETPIWSRPGSLAPEAVEATKKAIAEQNPMKRYGTPAEAAATVTFLLSSESSYTLGSELFVDGGLTQL